MVGGEAGGRCGTNELWIENYLDGGDEDDGGGGGDEGDGGGGGDEDGGGGGGDEDGDNGIDGEDELSL